MADGKSKWSVRERVAAVLGKKQPDRHPFIDRLESLASGMKWQRA